MDKMSLTEQYVACPFCNLGVKFNNGRVVCERCGRLFSVIDGDILSMLRGDTSADTEFSMAKWDAVYAREFFLKEAEREYRELFLDDFKRQVLEYVRADPEGKKTYLEIGCGQGFVGEELAKDGWLFIGVDFSVNALKSLKTRLDNRGIENYLLIHGDVQALPVRDNSVDLVYGGGVMEHFKDTQVVVDHIFRVLRKGGVSFNTVPLFNIGNLLYRSLWGSIPNVPVLKQLAELVHLKMLGGKHMAFGYELQFTTAQLRKLHTKAGFKAKNILVDRFDCVLQLHRIAHPRLKEFLRGICRKYRQFWPGVKVIGVKE